MAINELYQELIIDHGRRPRNFSINENATHMKEGLNPLCGDKIIVYLTINNDVVENISFQGSGCAISMASASLMTEAIKGKTVGEAKEIFQQFHQLLTQDQKKNFENLGKLAVLSGVAAYPMRVKCATLAWHTLMGAMNRDDKIISTEK